MTRADLKLSSFALTVHDLGEALGFYRDVLGFEVRAAADLGGTRRVSVGPPSRPDVQILLQSPGADPVVSPADRQAIVDLMAKSLLGCLVFVTDDCDATFEHIEAAGAEVMQEPISRPDDVRDCAFLDPSGNMLRFTQPRQVNRAHAAPDPRTP
ncbi:VOC family protein [Actinomadura rubrisoli]|uniref:VOC family protein n=1 Tax=Actinomadura rubrisoli TaxID=2530368 RepID=A0A4V2YZE5_9ACTN|nr:VOC family protein [Actinomadura rubrisoli]TDD96667.1 VOC family protein [Actinomadura rubrisoli]